MGVANPYFYLTLNGVFHKLLKVFNFVLYAQLDFFSIETKPALYFNIVFGGQLMLVSVEILRPSTPR